MLGSMRSTMMCLFSEHKPEQTSAVDSACNAAGIKLVSFPKLASARMRPVPTSMAAKASTRRVVAESSARMGSSGSSRRATSRQSSACFCRAADRALASASSVDGESWMDSSTSAACGVSASLANSASNISSLSLKPAACFSASSSFEVSPARPAASSSASSAPLRKAATQDSAEAPICCSPSQASKKAPMFGLLTASSTSTLLFSVSPTNVAEVSCCSTSSLSSLSLCCLRRSAAAK
mmetsp:Transcript_16923/g.29745  ORF Transcript_16923/g.29745 Transcript_16923/m.29745 type:complete len:238 (-) Transcript_16923:300-1013(-)